MKWHWQRAKGGGGLVGAPALYAQLRPMFAVLRVFGVLPVTLDGPKGKAVDSASIRAHAVLWHRLNDALVALGTGWGKTCSSLMLVVFVQWIVAFFTLASVLLTGVGLNQVALMSIIAGISFFLLFFPCDSAQLAINAVGRGSRDALLRLSTGLMDEEVLAEFLKTSVTYVVVLIQFATSAR